ncbi:MAG: hypothetical protein ACI3X9_10310 [Bacteroidaceae bacterium]
MKRTLITLREAIRRGILSIFPRPLAPHPAALPAACTLMGCTAPRQAMQPPVGTTADTLSMKQMRYDSIHVWHDRTLDRTRDTVVIRDHTVEHRYRLLRDTVRIVRLDSVPYRVTVVETREVPRPRTAFDTLCRCCFGIVAALLLIIIHRTVRKTLPS